MKMNAEQFEEFAALAAVDPGEATGANTDPEATGDLSAERRQSLGHWRDLGAALAMAVTPALPPPPGLKQKIMDRLSPKAASSDAPTAEARGFSFILEGEGAWQSTPVAGVRMKQLSVDRSRGYAMMLMDLAPGAHYPEHHHSGAEECYVLSGDFHVEGRSLRAGDFHHAGAGSDHGESFTREGCRLLVVVSGEDYAPA